MWWLSIWMACGPGVDGTGTSSDEWASLTRASMALTGRRPSAESLARVESDPGALDQELAKLVTTDAFVQTMVDLHVEQWSLQAATKRQLPGLGPLRPMDDGLAVSRSLDREMSSFVRKLAEDDAPYDQMVTADFTMADAIVAQAFAAYDRPGPQPTAADDDGEWRLTRYTDGRPTAGLLSTNGFLQRYMSSEVNQNRTRANFVASELLCDDFFDSAFVDLFDPEDDTTLDQCQSCHQALDPLAATFDGFRRYVTRQEVSKAYEDGCPMDAPCYPLAFWRPQGFEYDGMMAAEPGYYGQAVTDVGDLGQAIASDPRFDRCTVRRFDHYFAQGGIDRLSKDEVDDRVAGFVAAGRSMRWLALNTVTRLDSSPRVSRAEQLDGLLTDLTGFSFEQNLCAFFDGDLRCHGHSLARSDLYGLHTVLGGTDGWRHLEPDLSPTPMRELALDWWASEAAVFVVDADAARPASERRLLTRVQSVTDTRPREVDDQLVALHRRIYGVQFPDIAATRDLFHAANGSMGTKDAWVVVIAAMLQTAEVTRW